MYELSNFMNDKAFIYEEKVTDGKIVYSNKICINIKGEKLFELPDKDMFCFNFEPEDVAFVSNHENKEALMNNKGEFLTDFIYDSILGGSEEGLFEVKRNGKHGHIDINGKEIIPCMYDDGCYFSEGVAAEYLNGKCGMVDYFNNTVIPFEYDDIFICKNNLISAKKNGKYGLINKNNKVAFDFLYDEIDCWQTRDCLVYQAKKGDKWGLIDRYNNIIEDFIYDDSQLISDNEDNAGEFIFLLKGDKKAVYSTKKKKFITEFVYDFIGYLSEGRICVYKDGKCGFIDTFGEIVIPCIYDIKREHEFNEGVCVVTKDGKDGMTDLSGNVVVPFEYYRLNDCHEGLICTTCFDRQEGYINKKGEIIIPFGKYCLCSDFNCGLASVCCEKFGHVYINKQGEILKLKI